MHLAGQVSHEGCGRVPKPVDVAQLFKHQGIGRMAVDSINFGHDEVKDQHIYNDGRNIRGLWNTHHQRLNPGECVVVNENSMRRFESDAGIVEHIHSNPRNGQVFLG